MPDNEFDKTKAFLAMASKIVGIAVFTLALCGIGVWLDAKFKRDHADVYEAYHWIALIAAYFWLNIMGGIARRIYLNYKAAVSDDEEHWHNQS